MKTSKLDIFGISNAKAMQIKGGEEEKLKKKFDKAHSGVQNEVDF